MTTKRFTLRTADVVALLLVLFVTLAAAPSAISRARELANRTSCGANLSGISKAMIVYANENNDVLPCPQGISDSKYSLTFAPATAKTNDAAHVELHAHKGDPVACLWMNVLEGGISPKSLICKSDPFQDKAASAVTDAKGGYFANPEKSSQLSYSINFPWTANGNIGGQWKANIDETLPILSDIAPLNEPKASPRRDPTMKDPVEVVLDDKGQPTTAPATAPGAAASTKPADVVKGFNFNSSNHQFEGQNIAFGDAHVEWRKTPEVTRSDKSTDNIWTRSAKEGEQVISPGDIGGPLPAKRPYDAVMIPARGSDGSLK